MRRPKLLYVQEFKDRHGRVRRYFRRSGYERVPLPGLPGSSEFREAYAAALDNAAKKPIGIDRSLPGSIGAAIVSYLQSAAFGALAPETRRTRKSILEAFRIEHGHRPLSGFSTRALQIMVTAKSATPDAARNFLNTIKAAAKHWRLVGLMKHDPATGISRPKIRTSGYHTWTEQEIAKFEERHPVGTKARLALALLLFTAQRRQDVIRMGPQHRQNGFIRVRQRKTGRVLDIPVHSELARILDATPTEHLTFLVTHFGRPFGDAGFGNWMRDRCNEAGLPKGVAAHGLRKAACRRLAEAGCSEQQIMSISGHRNSREVQIYVQAASQKHMASAAIRTVTEAFPATKAGTPSVKP